MIATCPTCRNTGAVDERYCSCEAAMALRARINADPRVQQLNAKIERILGGASERTILVHVDAETSLIHPLDEVPEVTELPEPVAVAFEPDRNRIVIVLPSTGEFRVSVGADDEVLS